MACKAVDKQAAKATNSSSGTVFFKDLLACEGNLVGFKITVSYTK